MPSKGILLPKMALYKAPGGVGACRLDLQYLGNGMSTVACMSSPGPSQLRYPRGELYEISRLA
jgi:hypothetical protein